MKSIWILAIPVLSILWMSSSGKKKEAQPKTNSASPISAEEIFMKEERQFTLMEREAEYLMNIWPGTYDNVEQLMFDKDAGRSNRDAGQHRRIQTRVSRVTHADMSEYLLYVEEMGDNDPEIRLKQELFELLPENDHRHIRIRRYRIKDASELWMDDGANDIISTMGKEEFERMEYCDLILQREGRSFIATTENKRCDVDGSDYLRFQIRIKDGEYAFREQRISSATNEIIKDHLREEWYILPKARCFQCMIDFPREKGGRPVVTHHYIDIHDQGGQFNFDYPDGRKMVLTMRNTWSYGMQRNTFVIVLQENDLEGPVLIYSWGQDEADRIGMNPGWIRVQCDLKNDRNSLLQHQLRHDS